MQPSILIMEESKPNLALMEILLKLHRFNIVGITQHWDESIEMARKYLPDLILMDVGLCGDGIPAAESIINSTGKPVVFISGHASQSIIDKAMQTRASAYIIKPFKSMQLITTIQEVLRANR